MTGTAGGSVAAHRARVWAPGGLAVYGVAGTLTRRLAGAVIGTQGLVVFFGALVARGLAVADGRASSGALLAAGSALAVLCILAAGSLRRPWGLTLGWALQVVTLLGAVVVPLMLVAGAVFLALWVTVLLQGRRLDEHTARVDAAWHAAHPEEPRPTVPPE